MARDQKLAETPSKISVALGILSTCSLETSMLLFFCAAPYGGVKITARSLGVRPRGRQDNEDCNLVSHRARFSGALGLWRCYLRQI
jgi:hypothetical protein